MKRKLGAVLTTLGLAALLAVPLGGVAVATDVPPETVGADCNKYQNHSGHLPSQYDFGVFIEFDPAVKVVSQTSENPRDYDAGPRWDVVYKCKYLPTTTTSTIVTTTTVPQTSTTTTVPATTTTTVVETTTTTEQETTTTTVVETTTTTEEVTTTTVTETTTTQPELPFTGPENAWLGLVGAALLAAGATMVKVGGQEA